MCRSFLTSSMASAQSPTALPAKLAQVHRSSWILAKCTAYCLHVMHAKAASCITIYMYHARHALLCCLSAYAPDEPLDCSGRQRCTLVLFVRLSMPHVQSLGLMPVNQPLALSAGPMYDYDSYSEPTVRIEELDISDNEEDCQGCHGHASAGCRELANGHSPFAGQYQRQRPPGNQHHPSQLPVCRFFQSPEGCYKGNSCTHQHISANQPLCAFYDSPEGCRKGVHCTFQHVRNRQEQGGLLSNTVSNGSHQGPQHLHNHRREPAGPSSMYGYGPATNDAFSGQPNGPMPNRMQSERQTNAERCMAIFTVPPCRVCGQSHLLALSSP